MTAVRAAWRTIFSEFCGDPYLHQFRDSIFDSARDIEKLA